MLVIGLTGGIGVGKSTVAALFRRRGLPVYEADGAVHRLLARGGKAVRKVARLFPQAHRAGVIDRQHLGRLVFHHPQHLKKLEKILHPLVHQAENEFLRKALRQKKKAAVLEIPLLFETGGQKRCDYVVCVTAPKAVQKARAMRRPGMTKAKLEAILARQMPDRKKRVLSDFVIDTGGSYRQTEKQLQQVLKKVLKD